MRPNTKGFYTYLYCSLSLRLWSMGRESSEYEEEREEGSTGEHNQECPKKRGHPGQRYLKSMGIAPVTTGFGCWELSEPCNRSTRSAEMLLRRPDIERRAPSGPGI